MERMNWTDICRREEYVGRWVALDGCRYDSGSGRATEGAVVDVDDDLVELMNRIRESDYQGCEILFCAEDGHPSHASDAEEPDPFRNTAH
ncbi:MAG: hypothetical protein H6719_12135 [Sandaracinaceae bacterium]|nr:hypothetical protein [Sandaracinaceae bacterium]